MDTKVPVANLERIIDRATFPAHAFQAIPRYRRRYADAEDRSTSLMDVLADGLIASIREIRQDGLLKTYSEREHVGANPSGRFDPVRSIAKTKTTGRVTAISSRFERSYDNVPNRLLSFAIDSLLEHYSSRSIRTPSRTAQLFELRQWLPQAAGPSRPEVEPESIASEIARLPSSSNAYATALSLIGYLVAGRGLNLLGRDGAASEPVALINMDHVFEGYCRDVLRRRATQSHRILDGNIEGDSGSLVSLFTNAQVPQATNSTAKPDIVIENNGSVRMLIDVKYREASEMPARDVTNQLACYATRFGCNEVMALYPSLPKGRSKPVETVGMIKSLRIHRGTIDISRRDLALAEAEFCEAVWTLSKS